MEGDGQKSKDKRQKSDQDKKEIIYRRMVGKIVHPVADEIIGNGDDEDRSNGSTALCRDEKLKSFTTPMICPSFVPWKNFTFLPTASLPQRMSLAGASFAINTCSMSAFGPD